MEAQAERPVRVVRYTRIHVDKEASEATVCRNTCIAKAELGVDEILESIYDIENNYYEENEYGLLRVGGLWCGRPCTQRSKRPMPSMTGYDERSSWQDIVIVETDDGRRLVARCKPVGWEVHEV